MKETVKILIITKENKVERLTATDIMSAQAMIDARRDIAGFRIRERC